MCGISFRHLTGTVRVGMISNMKAVLLLDERHVVAANAFVELVVWRLGAGHPGSGHDFKYRLALVVDGKCVLRYDNESGKGDHRQRKEGTALRLHNSSGVTGRFLERSRPMEVLTCGRLSWKSHRAMP